MQTTKQSRQPRRDFLRIPVGAVALALFLAGCGGGGDTDDGGGKGAAKVAASASPSPSVQRALALMDDEEQRAVAGKSLDIDVLDNDSITLESGDAAALLDAYDPDDLTLSVATAPGHGTATVSGASVAYTAATGYAGEDTFTYRVLVTGTDVPAATAVVRIDVTAPKPSPKPTAKPTPKATTAAPVYYENCDAARAAGAAPVEKGDPGYAPHLDRDGDGVGCEPWGGGSSSSSGGSGGGSSSGGTSGGGGGSSTYYANCTAVRAAGAAPIHAGEPGYGRHLDRDGDGVACE
ncbi:calcium-binding protein [Streptomyces sp. WZ.A104]|uniref:excalibur calcium-binding domain-containing protein n=1 Tax=Streptomyces sp. WZ.A104 TaxID=2023771 RepID=UPI000BBC6974|nr:excalibur calcium-binding domain-containing protein [Streptomyces sp. WZ.A104]PCG84290.1 calcium-binding protein [Streptomyces sp. WZ.A104]